MALAKRGRKKVVRRRNPDMENMVNIEKLKDDEKKELLKKIKKLGKLIPETIARKIDNHSLFELRETFEGLQKIYDMINY